MASSREHQRALVKSTSYIQVYAKRGLCQKAVCQKEAMVCQKSSMPKSSVFLMPKSRCQKVVCQKETMPKSSMPKRIMPKSRMPKYREAHLYTYNHFWQIPYLLDLAYFDRVTKNGCTVRKYVLNITGELKFPKNVLKFRQEI